MSTITQKPTTPSCTFTLQQLDEIVTESLPMVRYLAGRLASRVPAAVDIDDLVQAGVVGLIQSVDRFDASRGVKFQSFASRRVHGAMLDYLRSLDWTPRSVRSRRRQLLQASRDLEQRLGGSASDEEIADEIGISRAEMDHWMEESVRLTSQDQGREDSPAQAIELLVDPAESPEDTLQKAQMHRVLLDSIEHLSKNERLVLSLYYFEQLTMQEVGEVMGVKQARVSQIHSQAVLRLRKRLSSAYLRAGRRSPQPSFFPSMQMGQPVPAVA